MILVILKAVVLVWKRLVVLQLAQANQIVQQILAVVKHFQDVRLDIMKIRTIVVLFHMEVIL